MCKDLYGFASIGIQGDYKLSFSPFLVLNPTKSPCKKSNPKVTRSLFRDKKDEQRRGDGISGAEQHPRSHRGRERRRRLVRRGGQRHQAHRDRHRRRRRGRRQRGRERGGGQTVVGQVLPLPQKEQLTLAFYVRTKERRKEQRQ